MSIAAATPDPATTMILRMLHAYEDRLHSLPEWIDAAAWADAASMPLPDVRHWRHACTALGIQPAGLPTLLSGAHRLAVLDGDDLRRVLAARVLYSVHGELARCIDGGYLSTLDALLGEPVRAALTTLDRWTQGAGGALPVLDLQRLAQAGLLALVADGSLTDTSLVQLIRQTIGMREPVPVHVDVPPARPQNDTFMALLPTLYPELSWLFG